jgi:CMP-N,N'-diacetyllegionaminic acid synthase
MDILGVVPARGGSKGVPRKNIADVAGRPLVAWTLDAARQAPSLTRVVVSTEDAEIAAVCRSLGAEVVGRPPELAQDLTPTLPVVMHALAEAERTDGRRYGAVVLLQPTTPLRLAEDLERGVALLLETGAESVVSVVDVGGYHPLRMKKFEDGRLVNYVEQDGENMRPRQELPPVYIRNGAVYVTRRSVLDGGALVGRDCRGFIMPSDRSVNIDAPNDLIVADQLLRRRGAA